MCCARGHAYGDAQAPRAERGVKDADATAGVGSRTCPTMVWRPLRPNGCSVCGMGCRPRRGSSVTGAAPEFDGTCEARSTET